MTKKVKGYGYGGKLYVSYRGTKGIIDNGAILWTDNDDIYTAHSIVEYRAQVDEVLQ